MTRIIGELLMLIQMSDKLLPLLLLLVTTCSMTTTIISFRYQTPFSIYDRWESH
jgi:hypothetical protein